MSPTLHKMATFGVPAIIRYMGWPRIGASFEWHLVDEPAASGPISIRFLSPRFCLHGNMEKMTSELRELVETQLSRVERMLAGEVHDGPIRLELHVTVINHEDSGPNMYGDQAVLRFDATTRNYQR